jgi:release factor glutamine methyltransferase
MSTAGAVLATSGLPIAEARALLAHVLDVPRERLIAHPETLVPAPALAVYQSLVARRRGGEPLAYLRGYEEFYGRPFRVTPDVLVPRPDTETLIEVALAHLHDLSSPRVLDLGTGSGCIAVTLKLERPDAQVVATDVSPAAIEVARGNALALGATIDFLQGSWYAALDPGAAFDLIVGNPPYVASEDPHMTELAHEPALALTDGSDGLSCLREIVAGAPKFLAADGMLAVEHGYDQASAVRAMLRDAGWKSVWTHRDAAGHERATTALRPDVADPAR